MTLPFQMRVDKRTRLSEGYATALLAALVVGTFLCGCQKSSAGNPSGDAPAIPVQVRIAPLVKIPDTTEYLSILKSRHSAAINPQVEGQITRIFVKSGDRVKAGAPLLQIDPLKQEATVSSQEAAHAAQEANLRFAKVSLDRAQKLFEAGVTSKQELDNAQTNYDAAVAQLKALDAQVKQQKVELHYYSVSSPMDGIVGDIPVHVGDRVTVATLLTTVDEPGALEAYIYVPVDRSRNLRLGLPVQLLDENGKSLAQTRVTFVSPQVDTETQTVLAKAAVPNTAAKLRIAQQVRAQVTWGVHEGPVVPVLSVVRISGESFVFVSSHESNGTFARQKVLQLGEPLGNEYPVLSGLKAGEHVITSGTQFLQDGMPVTEQAPAAAGGSSAAH
jgi:RND family efflux transporter MFP subunit